MTTNFTPAPWKAHEGRISHEFYITADKETTDGIPLQVELVNIVKGDGYAERASNAALIAAAPEMYACLNTLDQLGGLGYDKHEWIRSILKKARGEK